MWEICLHCIKICHYNRLNKKLNGQKVDRKELVGFGGREELCEKERCADAWETLQRSDMCYRAEVTELYGRMYINKDMLI